MAQIDLQFIADDTEGSRWICYFTDCQYSHVDWKMPDGKLLGARFDGGVLIRPSNYTKFSALKVVSVPCTNEEFSTFHAFNIAQLNKPYDMSAIEGFVFGRDWHHDGAWECFELQTAAFENSHVIPNLPVEVWRVTGNVLLAVLAVVKYQRSTP